ncbi:MULTISPECIES: hypothetical protein [Bacteroidales]|uniref:hypothetical protein n=1 Tax=Bacteroidales TaxID=171549 RepID=UPI0012B6F540|nr:MULTISPECIES: hypothetical protein [Bacteroidales]
MESADVTKVLPTVFGFTSPSIFRAENVQLSDFYGNEIPTELDEHVLVYLDKADNLNLFECLTEPLPSEVVECENVADAYNRVCTSFALAQLPQKDEWVGLCEVTTKENVLSQIREFANKHKMNGTVAQAYFGLRYTISVLQKAALTKTTPLEDNTSCRSTEEATQLYDAVKLALGAKAAGQTRYVKALNTSINLYSLKQVLDALGALRPAECKAILEAPSESKGETLTACIGGHVGVGGMQEAA